MKTEQFHNQFEIDRSARGLKAVPKPVAPEESPVAIADGSSFLLTKNYWWYDAQARVVRSTDGLRRIGTDHLGSDSWKVIRIDQLHSDRGDAVDAGQKILLSEMEKLRDAIQSLEYSKPKAERSLKRILQSRGL